MILTLILVSLVALFVYIKSRYKFWTARGFPSAKAKFLLGNIDGVGRSRSTAQALKALYDEHRGREDLIGMYLLTSPALLIINPELAKLILVKDFVSFSDRGMYYNKRDDPLSANLLTMRVEDWKPMRTRITPTFSTGKIKTMFDIMSQITDNLVGKLATSDATATNISETIAMYSTDIISNIAFGLESNCLADPDSEIRKYGKLIFQMTPWRIMRFFISSQFPKFATALGFTSTNQIASNYFMKLFIETVAYREARGMRRNDFMQILIDLKNSNEGKGLELTELASESFIFFGGGFETTSTAVSYALYEMAQNHDIQQKLRNELTETLGERFTYESLLELKYLNKVVSETLRKYPPIPMTLRKCTADYQIPNTTLTVPKGVSVMVPVLAIHHDPLYYHEPSVFDPERFADENIRSRPGFTYLPFGEGARNCVGMRFALLQAKIAIAKLILRYEFSVCEYTTIPMEFNPTTPFLTPKADIYLKLHTL